MSEGSNGQVSYSVKELLAKIEGKVDVILAALSSKVDRSEFETLRKQVEMLMETSTADRAVARDRRWLVGIGLTVLGLAVAVGALFLHTL